MANERLASSYRTPSIMERKRWLMLEEDQCGLPRAIPGKLTAATPPLLSLTADSCKVTAAQLCDFLSWE